MRLRYHPLDLTLAVPFTIARGTTTVARNVLIELEEDGFVGLGEAAPNYYYGERQGTALAALDYLAPVLDEGPTAIQTFMGRLDRALRLNPSVKAGLEMALWDLLGKRLGAPVYRLFGLDPEATPRTSLTIGLNPPERMAELARQARDFPILKLKVGGPDDLAAVRAVRQARPDAIIRVDANAGWTPRQAVARVSQLADFDIELVEQPVPAADLDGLRFVRDRSPIPVFADEACVRPEDVPRVAGRVDGIVIKLMKCGGLKAAEAMIQTARAHELRVMWGCMVESALAVTAAAHLSPLVDLADLDGNLLIADDPFRGVRVDRGRLVLPDRPGLGVTSEA